jgi:Methyltransferase domain
MEERIETDPYESDPARWGHSLANLTEVLTACLEASGSRSVVEVGAYAGDLTRVLLDWAAGAGARVIAIEPTPQPPLAELGESRPELELIRDASDVALRGLATPDAVIIDGDHNHYTVSEELRLIERNAPGGELPLLLFHDVGWPHGRRDAYWVPDRVPGESRQPSVERAALFPGEPGLVEYGLPMYTTAKREGGPGNGVLTAIEDFLADHPELRLAVLPPFFGFGVLWRRDAPWAAALTDVVEGWDRNPVLTRLEANRVYHLARAHGQSTKLRQARAELDRQRDENRELQRRTARAEAELDAVRVQSARRERVLRALLNSGGLRVADRISALRHPRRDWSWPRRIKAALGENTAPRDG